MVSSKYGPSSGSGLSKIARIRKVPSVRDRKSTRLNSSHSQISYAVFCLKKKKNQYKGPNHDHSFLLAMQMPTLHKITSIHYRCVRMNTDKCRYSLDALSLSYQIDRDSM